MVAVRGEFGATVDMAPPSEKELRNLAKAIVLKSRKTRPILVRDFQLAPIQQADGVFFDQESVSANSEDRSSLGGLPIRHSAELHLIIGVFMRTGVKDRQMNITSGIGHLETRRQPKQVPWRLGRADGNRVDLV